MKCWILFQIQAGPPVYPDRPTSPPRSVYCYNCGLEGHYGHVSWWWVLRYRIVISLYIDDKNVFHWALDETKSEVSLPISAVTNRKKMWMNWSDIAGSLFFFFSFLRMWNIVSVLDATWAVIERNPEQFLLSSSIWFPYIHNHYFF